MTRGMSDHAHLSDRNQDLGLCTVLRPGYGQTISAAAKPEGVQIFKGYRNQTGLYRIHRCLARRESLLGVEVEFARVTRPSSLGCVAEENNLAGCGH